MFEEITLEKLIEQVVEAGYPIKEHTSWLFQKVLTVPTLDEVINEIMVMVRGKGDGLTLYGSYRDDFGWEAKWTQIISMDPFEVRVWKVWAVWTTGTEDSKTALKAMLKLWLKIKNNDYVTEKSDS